MRNEEEAEAEVEAMAFVAMITVVISKMNEDTKVWRSLAEGKRTNQGRC